MYECIWPKKSTIDGVGTTGSLEPRIGLGLNSNQLRIGHEQTLGDGSRLGPGSIETDQYGMGMY